jgi:hypothetical protein
MVIFFDKNKIRKRTEQFAPHKPHIIFYQLSPISVYTEVVKARTFISNV